jgi:hypothetical protein
LQWAADRYRSAVLSQRALAREVLLLVFSTHFLLTVFWSAGPRQGFVNCPDEKPAKGRAESTSSVQSGTCGMFAHPFENDVTVRGNR